MNPGVILLLVLYVVSVAMLVYGRKESSVSFCVIGISGTIALTMCLIAVAMHAAFN